jgi:transcriptional regulatory protein RtcR
MTGSPPASEQNRRRRATFLKSGIATRNKQFNQLIEQIEHVAIHAKEPISAHRPDGAGKSQLARRIYELKKSRHQITGAICGGELCHACVATVARCPPCLGTCGARLPGALKDRPGLAADGGQWLVVPR